MSADRRAIHDAYRRTTYRATVCGERVELRIGEIPHPLGVSSWAFVTAANPHAMRLGDAENADRHAALVHAVEALGLSGIAGESVGDDGDWPGERSLLILGISEADAVRIARRFEQEAIVVGARGEPARLVLCSEGR